MALLVGLVSERVRRSVKRAIARHFYRHKYDYRHEWTRFTGRLALVLSAEAIGSRLLATVDEVLDVRRAAFFVAGDDGGSRLIEAIGQMPSVSLAEGRASDPDEAWSNAAALLAADGFTWVVPLAAKDEVLGLLAMAMRQGDAVTDEDEDLVTTLAAQAATALLNARLAEQLAAARELEALHRVSAFVLHDLKNCASMLAMVSRNAEDHDADPAFRRDARLATAETARKMRTIIERLSHLPKDGDLRLTPIDLNDVVREAVEQARPAANGVRISMALAALPPITADTDEIRRVVENLLVNAVEALAGEGDVCVRTAADDRSVSLEVSDNGPGVPPRLLQGGLFKPFSTTKPQGLGIGLYQVKTILTAHGADIDVVSGQGHGTTVRARFPVPSERIERDGQH